MIANDLAIPHNAHRFTYHGRQQYSANINTLEVEESYQCTLCKGDHTHLIMCKYLLDYIPKQGQAKKLPM